MKIFSLCREYIFENKGKFVFYFIICILLSAITLYSPYVTAGFIDSLTIGTQGVKDIYKYCVIFLILNISKLIFGYIQAMIYTKLQMQMAYKFNKNVIKHIQDMSVSFINTREAAYMNQLINGDVNVLTTFCLTVVQNMSANIAALIIPIIILFVLNRTLTYILLSILVIYIVIFLLGRKSLYKTTFSLSESKSKFISKLLEQLNFLKFIKVNSVQKEMHKRLDLFYQNLLDVTIKNQKVNFAFVGLDTVAVTIAQLTLFVYAGIQILYGKFTIGRFTMFSSYFNMMLSSVKYFINLSKQYQKVLVSYDRLTKILNQEVENNGQHIIDHICNIKIKNLTFSYQNRGRHVLSHLNLELNQNHLYCLAGKNGAGKSTLLSLITGLYIDEYEGEISYNDCNIKNLNMVHMRKNLIGCTEQEPVLLSGTISYNLIFKNETIEAIDPKLKQITELLGMKSFMSHLENGLQTEILEKSANLSGGEKQKISLLRVLLKDPELLILDEPTSAMDMESARHFIQYLRELKENKIIIVVTHDDNVCKMCDEMINLELL